MKLQEFYTQQKKIHQLLKKQSPHLHSEAEMYIEIQYIQSNAGTTTCVGRKKIDTLIESQLIQYKGH